MKYTGGCHCGRVAFEFEAESPIDRIDECNCSICLKKGYLHWYVTREEFKLLTKEEELTAYQFNTRTAVHYFCKTCGVSSFYIPRSHPDQYSVNVRCLDGVNIKDLPVDDFDGVNWEKAAEQFD